MGETKNPLDYEHYLFILAHPDDEIYTCVFISELTNKGKNVDIIYVTSGDYNGADIAIEREKELSKSMQAIGVRNENVHFMRVPERQLMEQALKARDEVLEIATKLNPDCIIGHDFEGGHNGHDLISFIASYAAQKLNTTLFVFPAYHGWPENRKWNKFVSGRNADYEIKLTDEQKQLQNTIVQTHKTQENFMSLLINNADYALFSSREVLRYVSNPIDYITPPESPLGYEYPGSKIKFEDFKNIIEAIS